MSQDRELASSIRRFQMEPDNPHNAARVAAMVARVNKTPPPEPQPKAKKNRPVPESQIRSNTAASLPRPQRRSGGSVGYSLGQSCPPCPACPIPEPCPVSTPCPTVSCPVCPSLKNQIKNNIQYLYYALGLVGAAWLIHRYTSRSDHYRADYYYE